MCSFEKHPPKRGLIKSQIMQEWGVAVVSMTSKAGDLIGAVAAIWWKRHYGG
ncbi:hypothetical protein ACS0TY_020914 [Phlomoides rotata]